MTMQHTTFQNVLEASERERKYKEARLTYLLKVEAAVTVLRLDKQNYAATWWHLMAMPEACDNLFARKVFEGIADALETKP